MEFEQLLKTRRSIRKYKSGTEIDKTTVIKIINAAQQAPSWKNSQTGRYYVVMSPEKLKIIHDNALPEFNRNNSMNAPVLIVTTFEKNIAGFNQDGSPTNELGNEWGAYDLGLQNENLILKAREEGLDTLIMGIRNEKILRKELNIPDTQEIVCVISLGYRDIEPTAPKRKDINEIAEFF